MLVLNGWFFCSERERVMVQCWCQMDGSFAERERERVLLLCKNDFENAMRECMTICTYECMSMSFFTQNAFLESERFTCLAWEERR